MIKHWKIIVRTVPNYQYNRYDKLVFVSLNGGPELCLTQLQRMGTTSAMRICDTWNNQETIRRTGIVYFDIWLKSIQQGKSMEEISKETYLDIKWSGIVKIEQAKRIDEFLEKVKNLQLGEEVSIEIVK